MWEREARYFYYPHGPLARVEIGTDVVHGGDNYHTIHGWIKGMNTPGDENGQYDPGQDGYTGAGLNRWSARDAAAFALGFYEGEYDAIGSVNLRGAADQNWTDAAGSIKSLQNQPGGLWNGNIAWMSTDLYDPDQNLLNGRGGVQLMAYQYDQLQRIKQAHSYHGYTGPGTWTRPNGASSGGGFYDAEYSYDANGNLETLKRWAAYRPDVGGVPGPWTIGMMDDFTYRYQLTGGEKGDNKLLHVNDGVATGIFNFSGDIEDQGNYPQVQNYAYDEIGNMLSDQSEGIDEVLWNNEGKVEAVIRNPAVFQAGKANLYFDYDAMGNRVRKTVEHFSAATGGSVFTETFYILSATGTPMAIYQREVEGDSLKTRLNELPIYGHKRLGMRHADTQVRSVCVVDPSCASGPGGGDPNARRSLLISEVYGVYPEGKRGDSPATPDGALKRDEVHQGEYMILVNTTGDTLNLDGISLTNTETGETLDLTGQGTLTMDQRLIIANTDAQDMSTFSALSGLDMDILQGNPAWKTISQTALNLDGPCLEQSRKKFGEIEVRYNGNVIDRLAYGTFVGLTADNAAGASGKQSVQRKVYNVQAVPGAADQPGGGQNLPAGEKMVGGQVQPGNTPLPYEGKPAGLYENHKGAICYEIANHLGNVLAVVTDLKIGKDALGTGTVTYYDPETVALTDYYPFGMSMPGRSYQDVNYRYGFNGQEEEEGPTNRQVLKARGGERPGVHVPHSRPKAGSVFERGSPGAGVSVE